jgi:hypothetical protein
MQNTSPTVIGIGVREENFGVHLGVRLVKNNGVALFIFLRMEGSTLCLVVRMESIFCLIGGIGTELL